MTRWRAPVALLLGALLLAASPAANARPAVPGNRTWRGMDARLTELERSVEDRASDVAAIAPLHERFELREEDTSFKRLKSWLQRLSNNTNAHPLVRDHARLLLVRLAVELAELDEIPALKAAAGVVPGYLVLGPFENTGGAGLMANHGPDDENAPRDSYDGMSRAVAWHPVADAGPSGVLSLHDHVVPNDEVVAYAQFFVRSETEQDAALRIGASDQLQVSVNGTTLFTADAQHPFAPDQFHVAIRLRAGWNRILLKSGQLRGAWHLLTRLTTPQGGALSGVTTSIDPPASVEAAADAQTPAVDPVAELEARVDGAAKLALALEDVYRLRRALHVDDVRARPSPRVQALEAALKEAPNDPFLLTSLAEEVVSDEHNRARDLYEAAVKADTGFAPAWLGLGRLRARQELVAESRKALARAVAVDPRMTRAAVTYWEDRADLGVDRDAAVRELALVAKKRPTLAVLEGWMRMEQNRGALLKALAVAQKLRALQPGNRMARSLVVEVARRRADPRALQAEWEQARLLDPHGFGPVQALGELQAAAGKFNEADALLKQFANAHPDVTEAWEALGDLRQRAGDPAGAVAAYRESLRVKPQNAALRRHVAALSGDDRFEDRYALDVKALAARPAPPGSAQAGGYVMGHIIAHRLFENGLTTQVVDVAYKLLDRAKAPLIRRLYASYVPGRETLDVLRAERITPRGEVIEGDVDEQDPHGRQMGVYTDRRRVTVDFGAMDAGDVIRLRYRVDSAGERNMFGDFFGLTEYAQEMVPKASFEVVVEAPASRPLHTRSVRLPDVKTEQRGNLRVYTLRAENLPAVVFEKHMPPYTEVGSYVVLSSYGRWDDMGRWYQSLIKDQLTLDAPLRQLARSLVEGAENDDEKIRRIHRYVLQRTRYVGIELGIHGWKPYRVTQVHARGYGDCKDKASLMVALLKEVGVDARLVLLRTWDQGPLVDLPSMWTFNHAIAYIPSRKLFLDGTAEFSGTGELPYMDQEAVALTVDVQTGAVEAVRPPLAPSSSNTNISDYVVELDAQGNARLKGTERFTGQRAPEERMRYQDAATQRVVMERDFSTIFPGSRVENVKFSDLGALEAPVSYEFSATIPGFGGKDGDDVLVPITLYPHDLEREYAPTAGRVHDVVVRYPFMTRNRMRFVVPEGFAVKSLPSTTQVNSPHFEFQQVITPQPDGYVIEEITHIKNRRIPVKAYAQFRQAVVEADRRMRQKVRLGRVGGASQAVAR